MPVIQKAVFSPQRAAAERATRCVVCETRPISVCGVLEEQDLIRWSEAAELVAFTPDQTIIEEGTAAKHFFNITGGTVRLFKMLPDGRRQITGFARSGFFLGLAASSTYSFGAEAIGPVNACRFSRARLRMLLDDFPQVEKRLLETAMHELVAAQEQMLLLGRKTARERVASLLLAQIVQSTFCLIHKEAANIAITRGDMADYLGLTIETVSREISRLKKEKMIALPTPAKIIIRDQARIEQISAGLA